MGWFTKKREEEESERFSEFPQLPELPKLPELEEPYTDEPLPRLPSLPNDHIGNTFSRHMIKEVITGKKEDEGVLEPDEFADENLQRMEEPLKKPLSREIEFHEEQRIHEPFKDVIRKIKKTGPVFVRMDKFEESLNTLKGIRVKISEIENLLKGIKSLKEQETQELEEWEREMQIAKEQVEKIDRDIFSKVE